jgi:photosystem I P700 chlorophyll a apoprotein A2
MDLLKNVEREYETLWQGDVSQFNESSTYLMGWLRDYLWLNSSQLINGYNPFGMNSLSVWAWMFLFGHLVWVTGFMFLISFSYFPFNTHGILV